MNWTDAKRMFAERFSRLKAAITEHDEGRILIASLSHAYVVLTQKEAEMDKTFIEFDETLAVKQKGLLATQRAEKARARRNGHWPRAGGKTHD